MKILYLCHRIPYPPNKGDKIRSFNQVKYLAERHDLDLVCLADDPTDLKYKADLEKLCASVAVFPLQTTLAKARGLMCLAKGGSISTGYFHLRVMQGAVDRLLKQNQYDAVVCFSSVMAEYLFKSPYGSGSEGNRPKLIMDFCDVDSDKWRQYAADARFPMNIIYGLEQRRLLEYEARVNQTFDHSVFVTRQEADLFKELCPGVRNLEVVQNGVDFEFFQPRAEKVPSNPTGGPTLVFTGAMDYHANVDGVSWFVREIWPALKQEFKELRFLIVGSKPVPAVQELGKLEGITVTGFVEDVREYYQAADVCVIPLRLARGVQNKVLEAMAMGRAVVTTTKAALGVGATGGEHLLVADCPEEFAMAVLGLLRDREARMQLGGNGQSFVRESFDWRVNMARLESLLDGRGEEELAPTIHHQGTKILQGHQAEIQALN